MNIARHSILACSFLCLFHIATAQTEEESPVKVNLRTYTEDQWQFSGNLELGETTLRGHRGEPAMKLLLTDAATQSELNRALESYRSPDVALNEFKLKQDESGLKLVWTAAEPQPVKEFRVEKRINDGPWKEVGVVVVPKNSKPLSEFVYMDAASEKGKASYRLHQVTILGHEAFSQVIEAEVFDQGYHVLYQYPNPVLFGATLYFELREPVRVRVTILDMNKKPIGTIYSAFTSIGDHEVELGMDGLPGGKYICKIEAGTSSVERVLEK